MKGLVLAHGAGVLHKNIKPTNVVINADGDLRRATLIRLRVRAQRPH